MATLACKECGTAMELDARFCGVCGRALTPERGVAAVSAVQAVPQAVIPGGKSSSPALAPKATPSPRNPLAEAATTRAEVARPAPRPVTGVGAGSAVPRPVPASPSSRKRINTRSTPTTLDRLIGQTLNGRYLVDRKIGEGGFGAVFRGKQVATGREVALKILHPHNVGDATVVARFRREAEACSKLSNPHTVVIYDFDETGDGTLYLAMELLHGVPLQDLERAEGALAPTRVLGILSQVAEALGEAHTKGVIHRDMKPENVMVEAREGSDFVKVLDFGIAKLGESAGGGAVPVLTAVGQTLGTLEFMSPEQLRGRPLDGRSDLYALGIMAYEMLTGLLPWKQARSPIEIIKFHLETPPPAPSSLREDLEIPTVVEALVLKMVAKDPADRHANAADLRADIARVLSLVESGSGGRSRKLWGFVAAAAVVVLVVAGVAFLG
jgi:serine/threonine protein kinase